MISEMKDKEHHRKWCEDWRKNNPDKVKTSSKKWYDKNKDYFKKWRENNPDKVKSSLKKYRDKNPDKFKVYHEKFNTRTIVFKAKLIHLKENPRTGECSQCHKKVGKEIKLTNMHHLEYHPEDPLKDTVELCVSCHRKQHRKNIKMYAL